MLSEKLFEYFVFLKKFEQESDRLLLLIFCLSLFAKLLKFEFLSLFKKTGLTASN